MPTAVYEPGPRLLLADHHHALETVCAELRAEVYTDHTLSLIDGYRRFEHAMIAHLAIEEHLLPSYSEWSILGAAQIRLQHMELRAQLFRLGVEVELHQARAERFQALIDTLQRHLRLEEATLYPWAEQHLPLHTRRSMFVRIGRSLRDLVKLRARHAAGSVGIVGPVLALT